MFLGGVTGLGTSLYSDPDSADWIADGNTSNDLFGWSVATGGDVNGDGYSDLLVGAITYTGASTNEGRAYLYYGGWMNLSNIPGVMDGQIDTLVQELRAADEAQRLAEAGLEDERAVVAA